MDSQRALFTPLALGCLALAATPEALTQEVGPDSTPKPAAREVPAETADALRARLKELGVTAPPLSVQYQEGSKTVYRFDVDATKAIEKWSELRGVVEKSGFYPVVCSDPHGILLEQYELNAASPAAILGKAKVLDGIKWLRDRAAKDPDYYGRLEIGRAQDPAQLHAYANVSDDDLVDGWKDLAKAMTPTDYKREPLEDVWIALVPTTKPYEVPAYFCFGNWNACPPTAVHVAVLRSWHERYGTEIFHLSHDTIEMRSPRPVKTLKAATQYAHEHFLYSGGNSVFQGSGTLMGLIEGAMGSPYAFLWWD